MPSFEAIAERVKRELSYYRCLISHKETPWAARILLGVAIAYFVSPIDILPDFLPIIGQLDDLLIVPGLIWLAVALIPERIKAECRSITASSIDSPSQRG
jgi:uncharacterized membrane protein YkvA (DUF1232 family)